MAFLIAERHLLSVIMLRVRKPNVLMPSAVVLSVLVPNMYGFELMQFLKILNGPSIKTLKCYTLKFEKQCPFLNLIH